MFRWVVGARVDRFDYIDDFVFSPRTTFMIKPQENHTFRVSYNRAYRSPSVINNHLDLVIAEPMTSLRCTRRSRRCTLLADQHHRQHRSEGAVARRLRARLLGGVGRTVLSAAFYHNWIKNEILFTEDPTGRYTAGNPPANWPLPPVFHRTFVPGQPPGRFTYLNFGKSTQQGFELGVNAPAERLLRCVRELLVAGRAGSGGLRAQRAEPAGDQPLQRRRRVQLPPVPGQPLGQLQRQRLLAGRARPRPTPAPPKPTPWSTAASVSGGLATGSRPRSRPTTSATTMSSSTSSATS